MGLDGAVVQDDDAGAVVPGNADRVQVALADLSLHAVEGLFGGDHLGARLGGAAGRLARFRLGALDRLELRGDGLGVVGEPLGAQEALVHPLGVAAHEPRGAERVLGGAFRRARGGARHVVVVGEGEDVLGGALRLGGRQLDLGGEFGGALRVLPRRLDQAVEVTHRIVVLRRDAQVGLDAPAAARLRDEHVADADHGQQEQDREQTAHGTLRLAPRTGAVPGPEPAPHRPYTREGPAARRRGGASR